MSAIARRYCPTCRENVPSLRQPTNNILHLALSVVTVGLWIPVWILSAMNKPYVCQRCGSVTTTLLDRILLWVLIGFVVLLAPLAISMWLNMK